MSKVKSASPSYDRILSFALDHPWAITRPMLSIIANVLARRIAGGPHEAYDLAPTAPVARTLPTSAAVIPVHGVIAPRMTLMSDLSGGTTFEELTVDLRAAVADPSIGTIVLDIDSPGGSSAGAGEFARRVLAARAQKPIIAAVNYCCCSAAYWIAACATEIVAAPSARVGSIGVYTIHEDLSKMLDDMGVKVTYLSAGKYKVSGNPTEPLDDDTRARWMAQIGQTYDAFIRDVANGRGVSPAAVRGGYGEGSALTADDALALGMIDRIETLDDTLARVTSGTTTAPAALPAAADDTPKERSAVNGKDRQWRHDTERTLLDWALTAPAK